MEKRKRGCTKLPPIRPNHSAQKANNVQALDVGVHSPETRDSTHFAPLVLPPINGSHPLPFQRKKGSYEQLQKTGLDGCHDSEASKEQLEMERYNLEAEYKEHQALLQSLLSERDELWQLNSEQQMIIADWLERENVPMPVCTWRSRHGYQDQLKILEDLKLQWQCKSQLYQQQVEELRPRCQEKKKQWDCEYQAFIMMMQEVVVAAVARRLGKRAALVEVKRLLAAEQKTETKLTAAKIRNLALQMRVQSREEAIGELEERTKAEKLKFENENYKTMILEYEEEVIRIKKGMTSTREFQSHLKETINFVELEIQAKLANLAKIKAMIGNKRKALAGVMITKDKLRADNLRLCQRCSLLRNKKLLQDFEKVKDACEDLQSQLDILKRQHEKLSVKCSTVKSKLKQSRPLQHCV
ncbi:coiled-coil domain-containing protein 96-like [Electrophorus electricus]|uniref:coiled-coil domain-containing protein 96-like n=1 Tax=Electrophorus electricus TaxID=8005 RepID=UPI0015CFF96C|nr:coiled-coil domain-containing protein 96-like [Electrophorus electricus]